jgi:hypothetical protein
MTRLKVQKSNSIDSKVAEFQSPFPHPAPRDGLYSIGRTTVDLNKYNQFFPPLSSARFVNPDKSTPQHSHSHSNHLAST